MKTDDPKRDTIDEIKKLFADAHRSASNCLTKGEEDNYRQTRPMRPVKMDPPQKPGDKKS